MKKEKINYYSAVISESNGEFKLHEAAQLKPINQYVSRRKKVNARNLARNINRGKLVIS